MRSAAIVLSFGLTACSAIIGVNDIFLGSASSPELDGGNGSDATAPDTGPLDHDAAACQADLATDKTNCGACGHDCSNGTCAAGLCTLAAQQPGISHVVTRGDLVYVALQGGDGAAASCARNGCMASGPTELTKLDAGASFEPNRIAINSTYFFVGDYYGSNKGGGLRIALADKAQVHFPTNGTYPRTYGVAANEQTLVWTANDSTGQIYACPAASCDTPIPVSGASDPTLISIDTNGIAVWADNEGSSLMRTEVALKSTKFLVPDFDGVVDDLTIDGATVYWSTNLGQVLSCPVAGCSAPTVVWGSTSKNVAAIAVAVKDTSMFWATIPFIDENNVDATKGEIHGCTLPACKDDHVIAQGQNDPSTIAIDDKSVYWGNSGHRGYIDGKGDLIKAPR